MPYLINPVKEDRCVFVTYEGEMPRDQILAVRYEANALLSVKRWNRIVVDITEWHARPTLLELISLASNLTSELPSNSRIALVIRSNQVEQAKIVERVARTEGVTVACFFEARQARNWVQGKPLEQ